MAKIILINHTTGSETQVATFKTNTEAEQCASFLESILWPDSNIEYVVDTKEKGTTKRRSPRNFAQIVANIPTTYNRLKDIF